MVNREDRVFSTCIEFIPPVYAGIEEFKELANAYNLEIDRIEDDVERVFNNFFIESLDEYGCSRWEKLCKLKINSTYTLEDRRFAIKVKLMGTRPYTKLRFKELLNKIVGVNNYKLDADYKTKHLKCLVDLGVKNQLYAVKDLLENILQADWTFEVNLLYNTHELLGKYTHSQLSKYTHAQLREEKMV